MKKICNTFKYTMISYVNISILTYLKYNMIFSGMMDPVHLREVNAFESIYIFFKWKTTEKENIIYRLMYILCFWWDKSSKFVFLLLEIGYISIFIWFLINSLMLARAMEAQLLMTDRKVLLAFTWSKEMRIPRRNPLSSLKSKKLIYSQINSMKCTSIFLYWIKS